jgi:hypothetical protein
MPTRLASALLAWMLVAACSLPALLGTPRTTPIPAETATGAPPPTARPSATAPPVTITFHRLRIKFSTTSDWTRLELLNPESARTLRLMDSSGDPTSAVVTLQELVLDQPLAAAEARHEISMTVDYAIAAESPAQSLEFVLTKGNLNGSTVELFDVSGGAPRALQSVRHFEIIGTEGLNPAAFSLDMRLLKDAAPVSVQVSAAYLPRMLWAFHYMWYSLDNWTDPIMRDRPSQPYVSSDEEIMRSQIRQAREAGIDGFITSWWGPRGDTDRNLVRLLRIAAEEDFKISLYFETLDGPNSGPLPAAQIRDRLAYAILEYGDHPAIMRFDGRPLIVIWASGTVPLEDWQDIFGQLRSDGLDAAYLAMGYEARFLEVFDGLHEYGVFTFPDLAGAYQTTARQIRNYPILQDMPAPKIWAATVQPGYDDRSIPGREGLLQERLEGDFYRLTWEAAIASDPDWIFITSWNEWWENTHIEPGELYGDRYLEITREYADRWKGQ